MTSIEIVEQNVPNKEESTKLFSRTLIESMNKQVRLVDSDNGLDLFCYIKCESTDSDTLKKCRGVVFNGDKIIMELGDGKLYSTCDFGEPINNSCNFGSFNNSDLVFITKDKSGKNKCRQKPYTLI